MVRGRSSISYILEALLPYSGNGYNPTYRHNQFFDDLEQVSSCSRRTLQNSFYRMKRQGFIEFEDGVPHVTEKGLVRLQLYKPAVIENAYLMVIFDIPECDRVKRQKLRVLLKELRFVQLQKSVWISQYETRDYLKAEIKYLHIENHVKIFESHEIIL